MATVTMQKQVEDYLQKKMENLSAAVPEVRVTRSGSFLEEGTDAINLQISTSFQFRESAEKARWTVVVNNVTALDEFTDAQREDVKKYVSNLFVSLTNNKLINEWIKDTNTVRAELEGDSPVISDPTMP
jgi:hypothetical protein